MQPATPAKRKRPPRRPPTPPELEIGETHDIVHFDDPMSGPCTIMLMKNLVLFLIQEGYDFALPFDDE